MKYPQFSAKLRKLADKDAVKRRKIWDVSFQMAYLDGRAQGLKEAAKYNAIFTGCDNSDINKELKTKHVDEYIKQLED